MNKKKNNIIKFPNSISKIERKIEAILFAASEPLDIETIEKRLQLNKNVKKIIKFVPENIFNLSFIIFMLGRRDSNPNRRDQNPVSYH